MSLISFKCFQINTKRCPKLFTTGKWWSDESTEKQESHWIEPKVFQDHFEALQKSWRQVFSQWPLGIQPHFISYEEIFQNGHSWNPKELAEILGIYEDTSPWSEPFSTKQNPGSLMEKVIKSNSVVTITVILGYIKTLWNRQYLFVLTVISL